MKAKVAASVISSGDLKCADPSSYSCERRIFSPQVQDRAFAHTECLPDGRCVDVDVRQFATAALAQRGDEYMLLPGGDYNREENRCAHKLQSDGLAVFRSEGDTLEEALNEIMSACQKRSEDL
ncbi:MAG: hypothetical protein AB7P49_11265 [Bdellovibrionales bacterium]